MRLCNREVKHTQGVESYTIKSSFLGGTAYFLLRLSHSCKLIESCLGSSWAALAGLTGYRQQHINLAGGWGVQYPNILDVSQY
ncbi:hypothetical protein FKM82_008491 [Ascaphus truei]